MSAEPITDRVTVYRCPFCRRSRHAYKSTEAHMPHCFKNPERTPRVGELSRLLRGDDEPAWWPGAGKVWDGDAWLDVPGYDGNAGYDVWPVVRGKSLDAWPLSMRLDALFAPEEECPPEF